MFAFNVLAKARAVEELKLTGRLIVEEVWTVELDWRRDRRELAMQLGDAVEKTLPPVILIPLDAAPEATWMSSLQ